MNRQRSRAVVPSGTMNLRMGRSTDIARITPGGSLAPRAYGYAYSWASWRFS
jgi:hypothetical protein